MMRETWRVSLKEVGMSLLAFLREKKPDAPSVKSLKRAIDGKCCTVNGKIELFSSYRLKTGDVVSLQWVHSQRVTSLPILYEDSDLLIVDKPAGLTCENRYFAPLLKQRAELIHRLDKETSGVVMLGKNKEIIELMIALFREKKVYKQYLAIVDGRLAEAEGKIENVLRKKPSLTKGQVTYEVTKGKGVSAITLWKCLQSGQTASLVLCEPITGRTHQLRIHLSAIGHPILGDLQYGKRFRCTVRPQRHLLHALKLRFMHPKSGEEISVNAPIPPDFQAALKELKL
jgi:RluA family pseudouridine synthase